MRMVRCYECGRSYDYDEDGFCPRCGAFNQPARPAAAVRASSGGTAPAAGREKKQIQRDLEDGIQTHTAKRMTLNDLFDHYMELRNL